MHAELTAAAASQLFAGSLSPYLLLTPALRVFAVNDAYLDRTERTREELVGQFMFDAFPDNPADPSADGVKNLTASLQFVLSRGRPHQMALQRYDIASGNDRENFVWRMWSPVNSCLVDENGKVVGVLHHVEDVTDVLRSVDGHPVGPAGSGIGSVMTDVDRARLLSLSADRYRSALQGLEAEYGRIRAALVAIAGSSGSGGGGVGDERRRRLWQLVAEQSRGPGWRGWADAVCQTASVVLPGMRGAAISLFETAGVPSVLAASDRWTWEVEEICQLLGEGPAVSAHLSRLPVVVDELSGQGARWPGYTALAGDLGVVSVRSFPLRTGGTDIGALSFYDTSSQRWPPDRVLDALALVDVAATAMIAEAELAERGGLNHNGEANRVDIATGMLCVHLGVTMDEAFLRLRAYALGHGQSLSSVARQVMENGLRLD